METTLEHAATPGWRDRARAIAFGAARFAGEAVAETLWPTRCALCVMPGSVLCPRCIAQLPYLDWWRACRRCGSPYGLVQCDACNSVALARIGRERLPYDACASAMEFTEASGRIVRTFKDHGERRLASVIADFMARALPPEWSFDVVTFVPATLAAYRYRGFDHAGLIASELATRADVPCLQLLARPRTRDQRTLGASGRIANLAGSFKPIRNDERNGRPAATPSRILLVDDVYTTGATLCAATDALRSGGIQEVRCLTFARV